METNYQYDEQVPLDHTVRFDTQSAALSETELALLESFVTTVATNYEQGSRRVLPRRRTVGLLLREVRPRSVQHAREANVWPCNERVRSVL